MNDFNDFLAFLKENQDVVFFDIENSMKDVSESQRTISREEWVFIQKYAIKSQLAVLRQYHKWLTQTLHSQD